MKTIRRTAQISKIITMTTQITEEVDEDTPLSRALAPVLDEFPLMASTVGAVDGFDVGVSEGE